MLSEQSFSVVVLLLTGLIIGGCATRQPSSFPRKSDQEKAVINLQLGARYLEMGMLDVAQDKLTKSIELDDGNADTHNALAVLYQRLERPDLAQFHFDQATRLKPDDVGIKNNYGRFLCETDDYRRGLSLLQNTAQMPLNNRKWLAYTNIGLCFLKQDRMNDAENAFRQALQLKSDFAPALAEMQQISYRRGQYLSARAFLERYLGVAEHTPQTLWTGMQTERALGNSELFQKYQQKLLTLFPASDYAQKARQSLDR